MRPTEHRTLHYDLSHLGDLEREYSFRHGTRKLPLRRHTAKTIAAARQKEMKESMTVVATTTLVVARAL